MKEIHTRQLYDEGETRRRRSHISIEDCIDDIGFTGPNELIEWTFEDLVRLFDLMPTDKVREKCLSLMFSSIRTEHILRKSKGDSEWEYSILGLYERLSDWILNRANSALKCDDPKTIAPIARMVLSRAESELRYPKITKDVDAKLRHEIVILVIRTIEETREYRRIANAECNTRGISESENLEKELTVILCGAMRMALYYPDVFSFTGVRSFIGNTLRTYDLSHEASLFKNGILIRILNVIAEHGDTSFLPLLEAQGATQEEIARLARHAGDPQRTTEAHGLLNLVVIRLRHILREEYKH